MRTEAEHRGDTSPPQANPLNCSAVRGMADGEGSSLPGAQCPLDTALSSSRPFSFLTGGGVVYLLQGIATAFGYKSDVYFKS